MIGAWRAVHIAAGALALATFWIPLVTRKGGRIHRRVGLVYSWAMVAWGVIGAFPLGTVFGILGIVLGVQQLRVWRQSPTDPRHWWYQHLAGMIGACIGTLTAFLVVNARAVGLETFGLTVWVAPGVAGGIGIALWTRYYRAKFNPQP